MYKIIVLSSSIRKDNKSSRVANYFMQYIRENQLADPELVSLDELDFPLFRERLKYLTDPPTVLTGFAEKIKAADGIVLISPEYNGGYPASLKNAIDVLYDEWQKKPIAIATVSAGSFAGMNLITSLQYTLWKIGAWTVPAMFPVPQVGKNYTEDGVPLDKVATDKRAAAFLKELFWAIEARNISK